MNIRYRLYLTLNAPENLEEERVALLTMYDDFIQTLRVDPCDLFIECLWESTATCLPGLHAALKLSDETVLLTRRKDLEVVVAMGVTSQALVLLDKMRAGQCAVLR